MLHKETVTKQTLDLIQRLMNDEKFKDFNLVGGTALSLQIGHRISEDIDLFSEKPFESKELSSYLVQEYQAENARALKNGVFCFVGEVKLDMLSHQYPLVAPLIKDEGIRMVSLDDIAAMKLNAITGNGTRLKDFIDVYALLEHRSLKEMLAAYETKYPEVSLTTTLKALNYHQEIQSATIHFIGSTLSKERVIERIYQATLEQSKIFKTSAKEEQSLKQDLRIVQKELFEKRKDKLRHSNKLKKGKRQRPKL